MKAKNQKGTLDDLTVNLDQQKTLIKKTTVDIPNLMFSPFLSAEEQTRFY